MVERAYLADPAGVELVEGAVEGLARLRDAGFAIVIVTNQSGIARGLYTEADYHRVAARLQAVLEDAGVPPDATYYCPHHPDFTGPCSCRKPDTGMYERAAAELGLDLEASWYVGDKVTDVLPAEKLGGRGILVRTGYGTDEERRASPEVYVVDDLYAAAALAVRRADARADDAADGPGSTAGGAATGVAGDATPDASAEAHGQGGSRR
jgi:D-glycero-D-manno-heptose 1,7-bisphosphate phosphatase